MSSLLSLLGWSQRFTLYWTDGGCRDAHFGDEMPVLVGLQLLVVGWRAGVTGGC